MAEQKEKEGFLSRFWGLFKTAKIEAVQDGKVLDEDELNSIAETKEFDEIYQKLKSGQNEDETQVAEPTPEAATEPNQTADNQNFNNATAEASQNQTTEDMPTIEEIKAMISAEVAPLQSKVSQLEQEKAQLIAQAETANQEKEQLEQQRGADKEQLLAKTENLRGFQKTTLDKTNNQIAPSANTESEIVEIGKWKFVNSVLKAEEDSPAYDKVIETANDIIPTVKPLRELPRLIKK